MSFDFVYEDEWKQAGIQASEVADARVLIEAIFSKEFIETQEKVANSLGRDPLTRIYQKHPLLIYLESPFVNNVCSLLHLSDALVNFKDSSSITDYISRLKKHELFKAAIFELEFASFLKKKGIRNVSPGYKLNEGEIDIFIHGVEGRDTLFECKTFKPKKLVEESRRALFGGLMRSLEELPRGFVICFKSYIEITEDNLKTIRGRLKSIINKAPEHFQKGETRFELFFGGVDIRYFEFISEDVISVLRKDYNEVASRTMVPQDALKRNFELMRNPISGESQKKFHHNVLAFDLPLPSRREKSKTNYLEKAKSDIKEKIKQHKAKLASNQQVCFVLENIPSENFLSLKSDIENDELYSKYQTLSILFVEKEGNKRHISYQLFPAKTTQELEDLLGSLIRGVSI